MYEKIKAELGLLKVHSFRNYLFFAILICTFRFPISAFLGLHGFSRITIILPMLVLIVELIRTRAVGQIFTITSPVKLVLLTGWISSLIYVFVEVLFNNMSPSELFLPYINSSIYFLVFPLLLLEVKDF